MKFTSVAFVLDSKTMVTLVTVLLNWPSDNGIK